MQLASLTANGADSKKKLSDILAPLLKGKTSENKAVAEKITEKKTEIPAEIPTKTVKKSPNLLLKGN